MVWVGIELVSVGLNFHAEYDGNQWVSIRNELKARKHNSYTKSNQFNSIGNGTGPIDPNLMSQLVLSGCSNSFNGLPIGFWI